jgi:glutamyl-tRNA synthetase
VADDLDMKITHVIRGEDHVFNTGKHIELFQAFDASPPIYAHIPLILNQEDGSKMSKRSAGAALEYYLAHGFLPEAVRNYLCLLGWSPKDDREVLPLEEVQRLFDWDHLNHHNARFDLEKCRWMNGEYLKKQSDGDFTAAGKVWLQGAPLSENDPRAAQAFMTLKPLLANAPVEMAASRAPRACAPRRAPTTSGGGSSRSGKR